MTHEITEQVFKIGAAVDPVTGQRCRGTAFIDEEMRQLEEAQILEERGNKSVKIFEKSATYFDSTVAISRTKGTVSHQRILTLRFMVLSQNTYQINHF